MNESNIGQLSDVSAPASSDVDYFETYQPPEPSYVKANGLSFYTLCTRLEVLCDQNQMDSDKKKSKQTLLEFLLPPCLFHYLDGGSPYPLLRLLMPDCDTERPHSGLKEKTISTLWAKVLGLSERSDDFRKLHYYNNPLASKSKMVYGDLSTVIEEVVARREYRRDSASKATVGIINRLLDDLGKMRSQALVNTAQANNAHDRASTGGSQPKSSLQERRLGWVKKLFDIKLSPLEHKWVVRILVQKMDIGIGSDSIISYYHPWAPTMYVANKDLRRLCATLSDPIFISKKKQKIQAEVASIEQNNRMNYIPTSTEPVSLGNVIEPALSRRTQFNSFLSDISERHRKYLKTLEPNSPIRSCLSLKFPTFVCETKMDGERMIVHVQRGVVSMHTRNGIWYSSLYTPILGPAIRKSLSQFDVDVILDGEIISWDDGRKEVIPFGVNRAVAKYRRRWCHQHGLLEPVDLTTTGSRDSSNVMNVGSSRDMDLDEMELDLNSTEAGESCWLKYVIFDILYIGGPDATKVTSNACKIFRENTVKGSIINYSLYQRKAILHYLLDPQENVVELIESLVIRSDGSQMEGKYYFSNSVQEEYGFSPLILDSINDTIEGYILQPMERQSIDLDRRRRRTDNEIHDERALRVQQYFDELIDKRYQEGTVFKDLSTPYALGSAFRKEGYWLKLKLDYVKLGDAADLDVVVLGAYFATGLRKAGVLNSFLVGCIDDSDGHHDKYMTLTSVNGGGISMDKLELLLDRTGFRRGTDGEISLGKWFQTENKEIPDFISRKSFQRSMIGDFQGWKCKRILFPDLWINPNDSFVLTLNASEIVSSEDHSAGISLRFPRIDRIRTDDFGDGKPTAEIETISDLHERYKKRQQGRAAVQESMDIGGHEITDGRKFLSAHRFEDSLRNSKRRKLNEHYIRTIKVPDGKSMESRFFSGFSFAVLEGTYELETDSIDVEEAKYEGWFDAAAQVTSRQDVIDFIVVNGGSVSLCGTGSSDFVIGGSADDARVAHYQRIVLSSRSKGLENSITIDGVLKWTFVFREKHLGSVVFDVTRKPRIHDHLFINNMDTTAVRNFDTSVKLSLFEFKRFLLSPPSGPTTPLYKEPWQIRVNNAFNEDEKRIISRSHLKLWWKPGLEGPAVIYPDIFHTFEDQRYQGLCLSVEDISYEETVNDQMDDILSVIPLVKTMGGIVTRNLDEHVTHILCDLSRHKNVQWSSITSRSIYRNPSRGSKLHEQLSVMMLEKVPLLVSSQWVRDLWESDPLRI